MFPLPKWRLDTDYQSTPSLKWVGVVMETAQKKKKKSSETKIADEKALTEIQHETFTSSKQRCGRPCFNPLSGTGRQTGSATRRSREMQEWMEPRMWNSLPEVSPTCACWGLTEGSTGDAKAFFWGHIKVCSMGSHWPGVLQEVVTTFYYQHLKRCRSPWASMCNPLPLGFFFLFLSFTVPPNNMCHLYVILLIIIVSMGKKPAVSDEMWIS